VKKRNPVKFSATLLLSHPAKVNVSLSGNATLTQKIVGRVGSLVFPKLMDYALDLKICHYDRSVDPARPEYNEHCIFVFWHEYIGLILPRWGQVPLTVVSKHRDGEWVNQTAKALGMNIVRGSTSRGGTQAIRDLKKHGDFSSITFTPDGPRGPRREMALGPVYLASKLQMPIEAGRVGNVAAENSKSNY
jgi:lysophospholipid acyltransferase (LPLAT)-like uncharacterized protein